VEESGGSVDYEANVPQGSIFTLHLPAAPLA
jgi:signal transduction histidine kinase